MVRRAVWLVLAITFGILAVTAPSDAQKPGRVYRIGHLSISPPPAAPSLITEGLRQGLRELGYVEGRNLVIEYRWGGGKLEVLPALAGELVRLPVDIIVTAGPSAVLAAKKATGTIPIVMFTIDDPVGGGAVESLARPGGNVTDAHGAGPDRQTPGAPEGGSPWALPRRGRPRHPGLLSVRWGVDQGERGSCTGTRG